jgi:two-component system, chemotaxis family, CheB/CheR fusion protein
VTGPSERPQDVGEQTAEIEYLSASTTPFPVVCVASSSGGERAVSALLKQLPGDSRLSIVVIHRADGDEGAPGELVPTECLLPVSDLRAGARLKPGNVYLLPSGAQATLAGRRIELAEQPEGSGTSSSADIFMRSLARETKSSAVAVVLSGAGSDGAIGLEDVKAEGGVTFAEDPRVAAAPSMPQSAIATGCVDFTMDVEQLAAALARIGRAGYPLSPSLFEGATHAAEQDLGKLFTLLHAAVGVDFTHYKKSTLKRRIRRRIMLRSLSSLDDYLTYLTSNPDEIQELYQDLLIKVTAFFRDPDTFEALKTHVFPALTRGRAPGTPIRIWVPGCSTGEEVYSLAISLLEFLESGASRQLIQIFGTDISEAAIRRARAALYVDNIALEMSPGRLRRFFVETEGGYQVNKSVRDLCIFARHNATADPPFSKLDLISCRNVMIYLEPILQRQLLHTFHYALRPTGFLMLGPSEGIGVLQEEFGSVDKLHKIFCKKPDASRAHSLPVGELRHEGGDGRERPGRASDDPFRAESVRKEADDLVTAHYAPAGVVIDEALQIVQFRGKTGPYLEPAPGDASLHLFRMAREGLLRDLRTTVYKAMRSGTVARKEGIEIRRGDALQPIDVEVWPLSARLPQGRCFLVVFTESRGGGAPPPGAAPPRPPPPAAKPSARSEEIEAVALRKELVTTREYLHSIIEELEATNEELNSANEEILSSNEELHSINEELATATGELQSSNEELTMLNEELQNSNVELELANDDFRNLLNGVDLPILMLGADLRIRRFSPTAEKLLGLSSVDIGRALAEVKPRIGGAVLGPLVAETVRSRSTAERQAEDTEGRWHVVRTSSPPTPDDKSDGAVICWLDTGARELAEQERRRARDGVYDIFEALGAPLLLLDAELRVKAANRRCRELLDVSPASVEGRPLSSIDGGWSAPELEQRLRGVVEQNAALVDLRVEVELTRYGRTTLSLSALPLTTEGGAPPAVLLTIDDADAARERAGAAPRRPR